MYIIYIYIYIFRLKQKVGNHYYQLRDCSPAKDSKVLEHHNRRWWLSIDLLPRLIPIHTI